jgi:hypothetical protein
MKPICIAITCIVSAALGMGSYRLFEKTLSEEKIIFKKDEKSGNIPVISLTPNGILCINISELSKQESPKQTKK